MKIRLLLAASLLSILGHASTHAQGSVKAFILAGDENMLRQGSIDGISRGPGAGKTTPEEAAEKHPELVEQLSAALAEVRR